MTPDGLNKFHAERAEDDKIFGKQVAKDIAYFHHLYAKDHDPEWLEIAKTLGKVLAKCTALRYHIKV